VVVPKPCKEVLGVEDVAPKGNLQTHPMGGRDKVNSVLARLATVDLDPGPCCGSATATGCRIG
jgi:hypothetical protein